MEGATHETQPVLRFKSVDYVRLGMKPDFDAKLLRGNRVPAGFTMLFTDTYNAIEPANAFLFDRHCRSSGANGWQNTQKAYADDLAQWWAYLRAMGLVWDRVTSDEITAFQIALAGGVSPKTSMKLSAETINRRVCTVQSFYQWAVQEGFVPATVVPEITDTGRSVGGMAMLPHVGGIRLRAKDKNRLKAPGPDEHVQHLPDHELRAVLAELGASPFVADPNDARPTRDRLVAEVALYTGMRVDEVVSLTQYDILDLRYDEAAGPWALVMLPITRTKGLVPRKVILPVILVDALKRYIDGERTLAQQEERRRTQAKGGQAREQDKALFLNGTRANDRDVGRKLSTATVMRSFADAVRTCGLTKTVLAFEFDPETGEPVSDPSVEGQGTKPVPVSRYSFHDLRHTFAVKNYRVEVEKGNPEPWKPLQARLGHKSLKTTQDIYLKYVDAHEASISDQLAQFYQKLSKDIA